MGLFSSYIVASLFLGLVLVFLVGAAHFSFWDLGFVSRGSIFRSWVSPFECGCLYSLHPGSYFGVTYLVLLVFFVIFDLEVALILNIPFQVGLFKNFFCYFVFLVILVVGYSFEAANGYADWGS